MAVYNYALQTVTAEGVGHLTGYVPLDFQSLIECSVWIIPNGDDATFESRIVGQAAANGQPYDTHATGNIDAQWSLAEGIVFVANITANMLPLIAASDQLGVALTSNDAGNQTIHLVGLRLKYKIKYPVQSGLAAIREEFWPCQKANA